MGVLGLMHALAIEGRKNNVLVNAISPAAFTRMTESLIPKNIAEFDGPEMVSPAVVWLCSEACAETALILGASAGGIHRVKVFETKGVQFDPAKPISLEMVADAMPAITDLSTAEPARLGDLGNAEARLKALGRI